MITVAIGDVHGCYDQLARLIDLVSKEVGSPKKFVFLGDYIDRGPESAKVVSFVREMTEKHGAVALPGNHEDMMVYAQKGQYRYNWLMNGGSTTLESYSRFDESPKAQWDDSDWMKKLPLSYEDEHRFFVHGFAPLGQTIEESREQGLLENTECNRDRCLWLRNPPEMDYGKLVVHGHTPVREVEDLGWRMNIDTACVFGGKLTAAVFDQEDPRKARFIQVPGYRR